MKLRKSKSREKSPRAASSLAESRAPEQKEFDQRIKKQRKKKKRLTQAILAWRLKRRGGLTTWMPRTKLDRRTCMRARERRRETIELEKGRAC